MWQRTGRQRTSAAAQDPPAAPAGVQWADSSSESEGDDHDGGTGVLFPGEDDDNSGAAHGGCVHRRGRKSGLLIATLLVCMLVSGGIGREATWRRARLDWDAYLLCMPRNHFKRMFRMDYDTFAHILHAISPALERNYLQSERGGGYVSPSLQLGMTLRWLAGGSYLDIYDKYGVSKTSFYDHVFQCCEAIIDRFPIVFPTDVPTLHKIAKEFGQRQHWFMRVFVRIVGAIDGILIKIKCPSLKEVGMPKHFYCRKGFFALNVQAVCDVRNRFVYVALPVSVFVSCASHGVLRDLTQFEKYIGHDADSILVTTAPFFRTGFSLCPWICPAPRTMLAHFHSLRSMTQSMLGSYR